MTHHMEGRNAGVLIGPENREGVKPVGDHSSYLPPGKLAERLKAPHC